MTTAIVEYSKTEAALADLAQRFKDVVFDVRTTQGMTLARKGRAEIRDYRVALEKLRVEIKAPALERCRLIDAEAKRITTELLMLEAPIDTVIKLEETRKEKERLERERIERERVERIQAEIDAFGDAPIAMLGKPSTEIATAIENAEKLEIGESFAELKDRAQTAKEAALMRLRKLHSSAVEREAEEARLNAEREELARLKAEQAERERAEQARIIEERRKRNEEENAARAKLEADQRAARERIEAEERASRLAREAADRQAREAREAEERKAAAERAEADRIAREKREAEEREARQRQAEEDARLKAERDRLEAERREQEERDRKAREEHEAKEREERRQHAELLDGRNMLTMFVKTFGHRKEFAPVAAAIQAFLDEPATTTRAKRGSKVEKAAA